MPLYQAILLALLQGLTEFLPVSSSAHLALFPWLFGWQDQGLTFDIALHLGTLVAVLVYFARDWFYLVLHGIGLRRDGAPAYISANPTLLWQLALATIPVAVVGLLLKDMVETVFRSPYSIGFMLIAVGLLIGYAERRGSRQKHIGSMSFVDILGIGCAQALAVIPGTSRSGITIATALLRNLDRESAARFSFLLGTPAIGGAAVKAVYDMLKDGGLESGMALVFGVGILVSAITGVLVIALFLRFLRQNSLRFFVLYRIAFGIIILLLAFFRPPSV